MEKEKDKKSRMDLCDLADMVQHTLSKVVFIREFFCHNVPDDELFTERASPGFHFIMDDIEDALEFVVDQLYKMRTTGSVKENENRVKYGNR
ncbi:MAG: hypothetical protein COZ69_08755 [Deltaproteobacteria bacterium CG_4_8_14_3_um_filter_45_9]|nr:MAG: hypothetical protein COZ69_08755 [Deltaproteobacteria bacterium CG_4_8_14_3_um_filter_45_9]